MERPWITSPSYASAIQAIVEVRKAQGLSQRDLAARLGKPRSFVSKIENRERRIDVVEFIAVATALGIDPKDLLGRVMAALPATLVF
jgi:transcriptional regulator with XRE-family HTH domain